MSRIWYDRCLICGLILLLFVPLSGCVTAALPKNGVSSPPGKTGASAASRATMKAAGPSQTSSQERIPTVAPLSPTPRGTVTTSSPPSTGYPTQTITPALPGGESLSRPSTANLPVPELSFEASLPPIPEPTPAQTPLDNPNPAPLPTTTIGVAAHSEVAHATPAAVPVSLDTSVPPPAAPALPRLGPAKAGAGASHGSGSPRRTAEAAAPAPPPAAPSQSVAGARTPSAGGAPATGQAAVGPAAPSTQPAPPKGAGVQTVYARVGDDITIALGGGGWTFVGGGASGERWKRGVRYESHTGGGGATTFAFKARALGQWLLDFQHQDASTGTTSNQRYDVHVVTAAEFAKIFGNTGSATAEGSAVPAGQGSNTQLASAEWLYKEGEYTKALDAYEKAWQPNDPALTQKIAELAFRVGRYRDAKKYWQRNFGLTATPYGKLAVAGLVKTSTALKDGPELRALFSYVKNLEGPTIPSDLLSAGRYLYESKDWEIAVRYLKEFLRRSDGHAGADEADFLLGEIYQGNTPMQNAQTALGYFMDIITLYPTSDYYDRAQSNIAYLNRYFFEIR